MKRLLILFTQQIPRFKKVGRGEVGSRNTKELSKKDKRAIKVKNKLSQRLNLLKENQTLKFAPIK